MSDRDGSSGGQSMHCSQSVWMAHWTRTSCNAAPRSQNHSSNPFGSKLDDNDIKQTHSVSRVGITSDISGSAKRFKEVEVRTSELMNESSTMSLKNLRNDGPLNQLSSILAPNKYLSNTDLKILEKEHRNYHRHSACLVSEEKIGNCSNSEKSLAQYVRQKNSTCLPNNPSVSKNPSVVFGGESYPRNHSGIFFSSQSSPPEITELEKLHHGRSTLKMPQSVHDVETMRICTSVEGLAGGPPIFSQTTQSFLITKKTDISLCKENQIFRESRVSTQLTGNTGGGHRHSLSPLFGHGRVGVKLQPISSSTNSDGEEDIPKLRAFEGPKNESSTETDTMDMDSFKGENLLSGAYASPSNKVIMVDPSVPPQPKTSSAGDEVKRKRITELPDINVELPAPPGAGSSMDNTEPSTSKTQSLDMELLFPSSDPTNLKSNKSPSGSLGPDPNSRWVKRLKSSAIAVGTKSSKLGESSSPQMANMIFGKITKDSISNTELTLGNSGSSSVKKEGDIITLSHPWIQRWRHNRAVAPQKKGEVEDFGPQRSKVAVLENFEKKQFPSIAAMALMGKAMTGFQPCEFRKRGSFLVWNTRSF